MKHKKSTPTAAPDLPDKAKRKTPTPAMPDLLEKRLLLRVKEYAELTGTPLATVYSLIAADKIDGVVRIGSSLRIPVSALRALVA